jgi:hypothetical protein
MDGPTCNAPPLTEGNRGRSIHFQRIPKVYNT